MPVHPDPWPGESLSYYDAADGDDGTLYGDIRLRSDAGRTFSAGDVWRVWYAPFFATSDRYLDDPTADVDVSWVLEVNSGSATIVASEGFDPDYGDTAAPAPTPLGTFTITGPGTLVIPSALMGAAEVVEDAAAGASMVRLEVTSGSVVVQQAKLRVWPTAGVGGGWSDPQPSWQGGSELATIRYATPGIHGDGAAPTREGAYQAARDDYALARDAAAATQPWNMSTIGTGVSGSQGTNLLGDTWTASWTLLAVIAVAEGAEWRGAFPIPSSLVEGVDWTRPPTEVPGDTTQIVQQIGEGSTGWADAVIQFTAIADDIGGHTLLNAAAGDYAVDLNPDPSGVSYSLPLPLGGTVITEPQTVALPTTGRDLFVAVTYSMPDAFPGGSGGSNFGVTAHTYAILPPYRVWVAAPVTPPEDTISILRHYPRNDGRRATAPRRYGQQSSRQSGRGGGYQ